ADERLQFEHARLYSASRIRWNQRSVRHVAAQTHARLWHHTRAAWQALSDPESERCTQRECLTTDATEPQRLSGTQGDRGAHWTLRLRSSLRWWRSHFVDDQEKGRVARPAVHRDPFRRLPQQLRRR